MVERFAPTEVLVGAPFQYRYRVTNLTDDMNLHNVFVAERTDGTVDITNSNLQPTKGAPATVFGYNPDNTPVTAANASTWSVGELRPKESKMIEVEARTDKAGANNTCIVAGYNPEVCVTMNAVAAPTIALALKSPAEVLICEDIPLRYEVTNRPVHRT
jgi:hypothetical protein